MTSDRLPPLRIVHLTESPEDARLLGEQIRQGDLDLQVEHVRDLQALRAQLGTGPDLVVADLGTSWTDVESSLTRVLSGFPQVPIVFRWGQPGNWQVEDSTDQIRRAIWNALRDQQVPNTPVVVDDRQERIDQHARRQGVLLMLSQLDFWDFDACLQKTTETIAELFDVERTSVWELTGTGELACLDLYTRSDGQHRSGVKLANFPRYLAALRSSLSIPATDARGDPRTADFTPYLEEHDIRSLLDAPIRKSGRVAGVLCLEPVARARQWSIAEQCSAAAVASVLARGFETRDRLLAEARLQRARRIETLGQVAAQIAHDFHNRLTVLTLLTEELGSSPDADAQAELLAQLESELERARLQVRRLLELERPHETMPQPLDLGAAIHEELPNLRRLAAPHELTFAAPPEPVFVTISPVDVREVLTNLVTNAHDAMRGEPGTCSIQLLGPDQHDDGHVHLIVNDTGSGFSPQATENLFEPFFTTKGEGRGSGLGLASVHHTITTARGRVEVRTRQHRGTRIEITLPVSTDRPSS